MGFPQRAEIPRTEKHQRLCKRANHQRFRKKRGAN